jgi:hypothetical protein
MVSAAMVWQMARILWGLQNQSFEGSAVEGWRQQQSVVVVLPPLPPPTGRQRQDHHQPAANNGAAANVTSV